MSRTREIEVWVSEAMTKGASGVHYISIKQYSDHEWDYMIKAKLIIELPERKVTISESEFEEIFRNFDHQVYRLDHVKEELFKTLRLVPKKS